MAPAVDFDDEIMGLVEGEGASVAAFGDGNAVLARGDVARPDRCCILLGDFDTDRTSPNREVGIVVWRYFARVIEHVDVDAVNLQRELSRTLVRGGEVICLKLSTTHRAGIDWHCGTTVEETSDIQEQNSQACKERLV